MANCNKLFLDFEKTVSLTKAQIEKMTKSRKALETTIKDHFKNKEGVTQPFFYIQGSYIMKTMILKKDGTYDVDLGVYFKEKPTVTAKTVQTHVLDAVKNQTTGGAQHLQKCIRVIYVGDYNVDLPVYYMTKDDDHPNLATKNDGWQLSDPKELRQWFNDQKDDKGQLVRIVKYLKVWADLRGFKMPSGIALSVWAARYFMKDDRDDKALRDTLKGIQISMNSNCDCYNPATPFDNLTDKLDDGQKKKFKEALKSFIDDADAAIASDNQLDASKKWRKHLGDKFPLGADEDVDAKQKELSATRAAILAGTAKTGRDGQIQTETGVSHKDHKFYGG